VARAAMAIKPAEQRLLEILLNHGSIREHMLEELREDDFKGLRTAEVYRLLIEFGRRQEEPSYGAFCKELDDEGLANDLLPGLLVNEGEPVESADIEGLEREAMGSLHSLRCDQLAERPTVLQGEINRAQRAKNDEILNQLLMEKFALAKRERALAQWTGEGTIATR